MSCESLGVAPRRDVRRALEIAAVELVREQGGATWRELATRAQVGFAAARCTVRDMARAGDLVCVGTRRVPGTNRPANVFAPCAACEGPTAADKALSDVLSAWHAVSTFRKNE